MGEAWSHDVLLNDLAGHLRGADRMVWLDMQLGPSGSPRPDAFVLHKSYSRPRPSAFEVKVSRSDFRSDTTKGKWQSYLTYAGSVTFAVPDGLVTLADVPNGCGLIVRKAEAWRYVRKPIIQSVTPPFDACMKLLIDGVDRVSTGRGSTERSFSLWSEHEAVRKRFGAAVALAARDIVEAERQATSARLVADVLYDQAKRDVERRKAEMMDAAKREVAQYEDMKAELCAMLGIETDVSVYAVSRKLREARLACDADARVQECERHLSSAKKSLHHALSIIAPGDAS